MINNSQASKGFSVVELIVIASVIGIIAGISIPSFTRNWEDERLNSASKQLVAWLEDQRRKAIQQSSPCRVTTDINAAIFTSYCDNNTTDIATLNLRAEIRNSDSIILSLLNNGPASWVFSPRGTSTTDAELRISMANTNMGRCIRILKPLGLLRSGKLRDGSCIYTTSY